MTRINVVPVEELSDQWLIAEYRELPRALKGNFSIENAPTTYKLGTGHVKWAKKHSLFLIKRYNNIIDEMHLRHFQTHFNDDLNKYIVNNTNNDYKVTQSDLDVNKQRLISKYNKKPLFYKWTNRNKPKYLK